MATDASPSTKQRKRKRRKQRLRTAAELAVAPQLRVGEEVRRLYGWPRYYQRQLIAGGQLHVYAVGPRSGYVARADADACMSLLRKSSAS